MKSSILFTLVGLAALQAGCGRKEAAAKAPEAPATEVFALGEGTLDTTLRLPGELIAFERVDLYAKVSSFVQRIYVDVGSDVKVGDRLATLEAPELGAQLAEAESRLKAQEAQYTIAKATYDRMLETSKTPGTVSRQDLEQSEALMRSESARLKASAAAQEAVAAQRNYLDIRAPFSGVISARNISTGAYVGPSGRGSDQPVFTLQQRDVLRLVVSVPEANVGYLKSGSEVQFSVQALPGEKLTAKVARLAGALDPRLRSERVEMNIDNKDGRLLPGMVAEVILPFTPKEARYIVPKSALLESTAGTFVVRVDDGKAKWLPVTRGRELNNKVEVFGTLEPGVLLARIATEELRDGGPLGTTKVVTP